MKFSAQNVFLGKVTRLVPFAAGFEVTLELPGGMELVSNISNLAGKNLDLKKGDEIYAVIKASNVMLVAE
jgi:molybdopterin-binding protein